MIKKGLLFLLLLVVPNMVYADDFYANVYIKKSGDVEVHEATVKNGAYDYIQRDLVFKYKDDNEIYSASKVVINRICESDKEDPINNVGACFTKRNKANIGDKLLYVESAGDYKTKYTLYNTNDLKSAFYMEYILENAMVGYDDVNEALITLLDKENKESFEKIEIKVYYPEEDDDNFAWIHGPIQSKMEKKDGYLIFTAKDFKKFNTLDIRVVTAKRIVNSTKIVNGNRKDIILDYEKNLEEVRKANQKLESWNSFGNAVTIIMGAFICTFYVLGLGILIIKHYFSRDKEVSSDFKEEYFTDFPSNDSPAAIEYLFNHTVTLNSFKASILYIIYKKGFLVKMHDSDFELIVNDKKLVENLTDNELELRDFLVNNYGNGKSLRLYDIKKMLNDDKSHKIFNRYLYEWKSKEITPKIRNRFYENSSSSTYTVMNCIAPFFLGLLGVFYSPLFTLMLLCALSFPVLIYLTFSSRRTKEGNELYYKWRAIRLFMEDLVTYKKMLPNKKTWGKYLAFAKVFGQSKMVANNIIEKMGSSYVNVYDITANEYLLLDDMLNNIFKNN